MEVYCGTIDLMGKKLLAIYYYTREIFLEVVI